MTSLPLAGRAEGEFNSIKLRIKSVECPQNLFPKVPLVSFSPPSPLLKPPLEVEADSGTREISRCGGAPPPPPPPGPPGSTCIEVETVIILMTTVGPSARSKKRGADNPVKMVLNVDLNSPPAESLLVDGASSSVYQSVPSLPTGPDGQSVPLIDVDAVEDDIQLLSSSRGFLQVRRSRRNNPVTVVLDDDVDTASRISGIAQEDTALSRNSDNKRQRSSNIPIVNCEQYLDLEEDIDVKRKSTKAPTPEPPKEVPKPPPPPSFTCPICMNALVKASSTNCGHIFCHDCIKAAVQAHKKCPNCRKKLSMNSFHRVYLPNTD